MKLSAAQMNLLRQTSLFYAVPETTIEKIAASDDCEIKQYEKFSLVYGKTEFSRSLGIVLFGNFGAAALFNDETEYATDITALCESEIIFFSQRLVGRMMRFEPRIADNYVKYLSERILFLNRKIYLLSSGTAEQRLASFLLDNVPEGSMSELPMPLNMLSLALNVSRASLYRAFDSLTQDGVIEKEGKKVCINNAERLKKIYEVKK